MLPLIGQGTSVCSPTPTDRLSVCQCWRVRHPAALFVFTLMLNTLALPLVYRALRRQIGTPWRFAAVALFAANPWIIAGQPPDVGAEPCAASSSS